MTEPIIVPVSVPGATQASKELDQAADSAARLASQEKIVTTAAQGAGSAHTAMSKGVRLTHLEMMELQKVAAKLNTSMAQQGMSYRKVAADMQVARTEAKLLNQEQGGHGGGGVFGLKGRAEHMAARFVPGEGGHLLHAAMAGGPVLVGLAAAAFAVTKAFELNAEYVAHLNEVILAGVKANQEYNESVRTTLSSKQDKAASGFAQIVDPMEYILNHGGMKTGELALKQIQGEGLGPEAIKGLANLMQHRGTRFGTGASAMTQLDLLEEAQTIASRTGLSVTEAMGKMGEGGGRYNRDRLVKRINGRAFSGDQLNTWGDNAASSEFGANIATAKGDRMLRMRDEMTDMFGPLMRSGSAHLLEQERNPMADKEKEYNIKLVLEAQILETRINADKEHRSWWDNFKNTWDPYHKISDTDASRASKELDVLSAKRR
jgi:hypothetical protein